MDDWKLHARVVVKVKKEHRAFVFLLCYCCIEVSIHRASPVRSLHWLAIHTALKSS